MFKGVIFDLDGTILNSLEMRVTAWKVAFQHFDINVTRDEIRPLIGLPGEDLAGRYYKDPGEVEKKEEEYFASHLEELSLFDDVADTFRKLEEQGIKPIVVTSSRRKLVNRLQLPTDIVLTIDDVAKGKPDPESYLKAVNMIKIEPSQLVVVGDSDNDLIPAKRIGALSVLVRHGRDTEAEHADYYADEISEIPGIIKKRCNDLSRTEQ